jgi:hypothetical protein
MKKCKVLILSANPAGTRQLDLDEEIREIAEKLRASKHRDSVELIPRFAARPDDFQQAILEHRPDIVHFSGHGSSTGELLFLDRDRNPKPVDRDALVWLFRTLKDNVRVVLLNACYSDAQAGAIADIIDCTIGMKRGIGDNTAIVFAASFYRAIGFGRSVQEAFNLGKAALLMEGIPEESTPTLWCRKDVDAARITLVGASREALPIASQPPILILDNYRTDGEPKKDHLRYRSREDGGDLLIEPDDKYLDTIRAGGVIEPLYYHWAPWQWRFAFPALDIKLVNNTDKTVYFHEALFRVRRSRLDPTPVPVIRGTGYNMTITFENVGWGAMEQCLLRFSLHGWSDVESQPHSNDPPYEAQLGDILEDSNVVALDEFFVEAGVDLGTLETLCANEGGDKEWVYFPAESPLGDLFDDTTRLTAGKGARRLPVAAYEGLFAKALGPFPDGVARLAGQLDYVQTDHNGAKSRHTIGVMARVEIGGPGLGLPRPPSYSYNVRFDVDGVDYVKRVPISQWLAAGATDRFLLFIGADKSSVHDFDVVLRYNDSEHIQSRAIHLALFISRPDARRVRAYPSDVSFIDKPGSG